MSEKKQINIDQIVQQYTHLYDEGYPIDDKVLKLAELYNKSKVLPIQVIDNLFQVLCYLNLFVFLHILLFK